MQTNDARARELCEELAACDAEIARIEGQAGELASTLAALRYHPALWLLLGRAGVDRPGAPEAVLGREVVTVRRASPRALALAASAGAALGLLIGALAALALGGLL